MNKFKKGDRVKLIKPESSMFYGKLAVFESYSFEDITVCFITLDGDVHVSTCHDYELALVEDTKEDFGYHLREIVPQGKHGTIEKILEEVDELKEASEQENRIMALVEASDLILAVKGYLHETLGMKDVLFEDLVSMARATERAFESGQRKPKS